MLTLTVNPIVLQTLQQHFPTPKNSASKALDKYIKLLTQQLTTSVIHGRNTWMQSKNLYSISIYKQRNRGSQIGSQAIRLQNWFEQNNLELFKVIQLGSNMSKKLSVVKLTDLVTVTHTDTHVTSHNDIETHELRKLLEQQLLTNEEFFNNKYKDFNELTEEEINEEYDFVEIDMKSLKNYIAWLKNDATHIEEKKKEQYLIQADTILRVAQHKNGKFYQKKKESVFGRNYYSGISVQNVNKELRRAMLGHCWEYDIRSSVFAWKMGWALDCYQTLDTTEPFEKVFSVTRLYLEDKKDFMATVRRYTFNEETTLSREYQDKLLKQAVTAISFGARRGTRGWYVNGLGWKNSALVDILKNKDERDRFLNNVVIKKFLTEQNMIDKFIYDCCREVQPSFLSLEEVRNTCGSLSKAKVIAYLYQHFETVVMDVAAREIEKRGRKVIARIHDAIIIDRKLGVDNKYEVEEMMKSATSNEYWHLVAKELLPYERPYSLDKDEIDAHKSRIANEEREARGYKSKCF